MRRTLGHVRVWHLRILRIWLATCLASLCLGGEAVAGDSDDLKNLGRMIRATQGAFSLTRAMERLTPEDEYFLGRAVAARLISDYGVDDDPAATAYLNRVGHVLALRSRRPRVFAGYHFLLLDSDEVNAFACPGAFILVTRGLLDRLEDEDMLAAVLAHEIAHVQNRDGLHAIEEKRWEKFWSLAFNEALSQLTAPVAGTLSHLLGEMAGSYYRTLTSEGYDKNRERHADEDALEILRQAGYDPFALGEALQAVSPRSKGFGKTHPEAKKRIRQARDRVAEPAERPVERRRRFEQALAGLR